MPNPGLDNLTPEPRYGSRVNTADVALQADVAALQVADVALDARLDAVEAADTSLDTRLDALEALVGHGTVRQRGRTGLFSGTRTVATFADIDSTNGKVTLTTTGGDLIALFFGYVTNTTAPVVQQVALRLDSGADVAIVPPYSYNGLATYPVPFATGELFTGVSSASHTVYTRHNNNSAAGTMTTAGYLLVLEIGPP